MKNINYYKVTSFRRKGIALLCAIFLLTGAVKNASAQTANIYVFSSATGVALETLSSPLQIVGAENDDAASAVQNIGFTFNFAGTPYTLFSASSNGLVRLGPALVATTYTNTIGVGTFPQLCPFWDDLHTGTGGGVFMQVLGSSPNQ